MAHVLHAPADILWGPDVLVQPDVLGVPLEEVRTLTWSRVRTLLLVAEVLSRPPPKRLQVREILSASSTGPPGRPGSSSSAAPPSETSS